MYKEAVVRLLEGVAGEGNVLVDEPMKNHTSFKLGGPADILVTPESGEDIVRVLDILKKEGIPFFIMGNGTNLIVRDKGIRGVVIKIFDKFNSCSADGEVIKAGAGILLSRLSAFALSRGLSGLEFAAGIPGTLGGAIAMNAGAYGGEMKDVVIKTSFIDRDGIIRTFEGQEHEFGYRTSRIQKEEGIVLSAEMKLKEESRDKILSLMEELKNRRKEKQPLEMPSAGSVFKRPEGFFAGKLIEDCGLRGRRSGGAQVSEKHCGFIVNAKDATAKDVLDLIGIIKGKVKDTFGVELQTEVRIIGEE